MFIFQIFRKYRVEYHYDNFRYKICPTYIPENPLKFRLIEREHHSGQEWLRDAGSVLQEQQQTRLPTEFHPAALSVAHITWRRTVGWLVNDKSEGNWNETAVT